MSYEVSLVKYVADQELQVRCIDEDLHHVEKSITISTKLAAVLGERLVHEQAQLAVARGRLAKEQARKAAQPSSTANEEVGIAVATGA